MSDTEYEGMKLQGTFCYNPQAVFPIYFVMRVSKKPTEAGYWKKQRPMTGVEAEWDVDNGKYKLYKTYNKELSGDDIGVWMNFNTEADEQIEVQMGVSFVSMATLVRTLMPNSVERTSTPFVLRRVLSGMMTSLASSLRVVQRQSAPSSIQLFITSLSTQISCRMSTDSTLPWRVMRFAR